MASTALPSLHLRAHHLRSSQLALPLSLERALLLFTEGLCLSHSFRSVLPSPLCLGHYGPSFGGSQFLQHILSAALPGLQTR